jgi:hypothetical protein
LATNFDRIRFFSLQIDSWTCVSIELLHPRGTDSGHGDLGPAYEAGGLAGRQAGESGSYRKMSKRNVVDY